MTVRRRFVLAATTVLVALLIGCMTYAGRFRIAATIWHWGHGNSLNLGEYSIPVPDRWWPRLQDSNMIILVNSLREQGPAGPMSDVAVFSLVPRPLSSVDGWAAAWRQRMQDKGLKTISETHLDVAGEETICIGGALGHDILHMPSAGLLSIECGTNSRLNLQFDGYQAGLENFYDILKGIRKPLKN